MRCRSCGGTLGEPVLDLGRQALPDFSKTEPAWEKAPLALAACGSCGLHQLTETVDRDRLFTNYWYRSALSETMRDALREVVHEGVQTLEFESEDVVVDIGSNDGFLLSLFTDATTVGFEPSRIGAAPVKLPDFTITEYFNAAAYDKRFEQRAKLVFSIAMFYSVEDPNAFVHDVAHILDKDGVWVLQMNDLLGMAQDLAYDIVGHEHVCVWSLAPLEKLLARHGLEIVDAARIPLNGGSARFFIKHRGAVPAMSIEKEAYALQEERALRRDWPSAIELLIEQTRNVVRSLFIQGAKIHVKGASTRGCTILQSCRLDIPWVEAAADRDPAKWGKRIPGTDIPILSEEQSRAMQPDFYLVLPYSYINQFREREQAFVARGGRFLLPVPEVAVVG